MAERLPTWGYYSEDRGLQGAADPELILIVDPIDGTRPAAAGLEAACVSIAAVPPAAAPTMGDVVAGVVQEIKSGDVFAAEKGAGFEMRRGAGSRRARPPHRLPAPRSPSTPRRAPTSRGSSGRSASADVRRWCWPACSRSSSTARASAVRCSTSARRPSRSRASSPASSTRTSTSARRSSPPTPQTEAEFRRVGMGGVLCNSPYDLAAAHLICREAGLPIGDADGTSLDGKPVLGSDASYQMACIASGNDELQARSGRGRAARHRPLSLPRRPGRAGKSVLDPGTALVNGRRREARVRGRRRRRRRHG